MRVKVNITLTDQSSEEAMGERGVTRETLRVIYTRGFENFLESIRAAGVETDLRVAVDDNTKEEK